MDERTREWFRAQGRIGGKKRVRSLTGDERSALAKNAAKARWGWRLGWRYKVETSIHGDETRAVVRVWQAGENPRRDPGMIVCEFRGSTIQRARVFAKLFFRHWLHDQMPRNRKERKG